MSDAKALFQGKVKCVVKRWVIVFGDRSMLELGINSHKNVYPVYTCIICKSKFRFKARLNVPLKKTKSLGTMFISWL